MSKQANKPVAKPSTKTASIQPVKLIEKQSEKSNEKQPIKQAIKLLNIEEIDFTKNDKKIQR